MNLPAGIRGLIRPAAFVGVGLLVGGGLVVLVQLAGITRV
jgi:hypothetical protein